MLNTLNNKGLLISIEGSDGSGKTTQIKNIESYLIKKNIEIYVTREPGGTIISEKLREILLDSNNKNMDSLTEMLLYSASRRQHIKEIIEPKLNNNITVISDRFYHSNIAYQGYGRGLLEETLLVNKLVTNINNSNLKPDLTIYLRLPLDISKERKLKKIKEDNSNLDRLENENDNFFSNVYDGFESIFNNSNNEINGEILVIDAKQSEEKVFEEIRLSLDNIYKFKN